jgi:hypothetical protein
LDRATETFRNLIEHVRPGISGSPEITEILTKNLETPITQTLLEQIGIGTVSEQMTRYQAFDARYRAAVAEELRSGIANQAQKNALEAALDPNSPINLNLISNKTVQKELREQFHMQVLKTKDLIEGAGTPGIHLPSGSALGRRSAIYSTSMSGGYSPVLDLLEQRNF